MEIDLIADADRCYRAVESRDSRFDGWFIVGVRTTGIYCRPSCPTPIRPKRTNVDFYATPAAAQLAGFRACKRCRPDATPGSPQWDLRADLVGRAMRLIADGTVDREGVGGLAGRLAVSERHLHRLMVAEVGASPVAVARAHRAQTARTLIETTAMKFADVAFAAGFSSVRQFNDTVREVFAQSPSELRSKRSGSATMDGPLVLRLPLRQPIAAELLFGWLRTRSIEGVAWNPPTSAGEWAHARTLSLPRGTGVVELRYADDAPDHVTCRLDLASTADLAVAVERCRRLLDLDADPAAVNDVLRADPDLVPLVDRHPGLRVPGSVDGFETTVFAILGQQVSVRAAVTMAGRIVERHGGRVELSTGDQRRTFPEAADLAEADLDGLGLTGRRRSTIRAVAAAVAGGLEIAPGADRHEVRQRLLELPGIGPWTADYVAMRALRDPDVILPGDLIVRRAAGQLGLPDDAKSLAVHSARWAPWRSYVAHHLWAHTTAPQETLS